MTQDLPLDSAEFKLRNLEADASVARKRQHVVVLFGCVVLASMSGTLTSCCVDVGTSSMFLGLSGVDNTLHAYSVYEGHRLALGDDASSRAVRGLDRVCAGMGPGSGGQTLSLFVWRGDELVAIHRPPRHGGWSDFSRDRFKTDDCKSTARGFRCANAVVAYEADTQTGEDVFVRDPAAVPARLTGHPAWAGPADKCWTLQARP